jgi:hypothetical protein
LLKIDTLAKPIGKICWIEVEMIEMSRGGIYFHRADDKEVPDRGTLFLTGDEVSEEITSLCGWLFWYRNTTGAMFKYEPPDGEPPCIVHAIHEDDLLAYSTDWKLLEQFIEPTVSPSLIEKAWDGEDR